MANVKAVLALFPNQIEVEEINSVSEIIQYQIHTTPALLVDGIVLFEGNVPEILEIQKRLEDFILIPNFSLPLGTSM